MSESNFVQQLLEELESGEMSPEMKMALAQGLLPLDQNDLLVVLFRLCVDADEEVARAAQGSLSELPDSLFLGLAEAPSSPPPLLHSLARLRVNATDVLRRLVLNKAAEDQTIELIARNCGSDEVLGLIAGNQERLLRHTVLFEVLLENPGLSPYKRQQLATYKEELLERGHLVIHKPVAELEPEAVPEAEPVAEAQPQAPAFDLDLISDFELGEGGPFSIGEMVPFDTYVGPKPTLEKRNQSIYKLLSAMSPKEKLSMAQFGNAEVRNILIRDGDRKVAGSVLRNPKLQENDIERYCKMRNINDEILKEIAANRMWVRNYSVIQGLVENPRTPVSVSMNLMHNLRDNHIRMLVRNREVPLALRTAAGQKLARKVGGQSKH